MNSTLKEQVRLLWDKCIPVEDKRFVDFYFEKRYDENDNIFIEKDNKVISSLQLISYPFSYYGKTIGCAYISGTCTDPEYHSQDIMDKLVLKSLKKAKNNGACFAALIPTSEGLFKYYSGTNFVSAFDYSKIHVNKVKGNEQYVSNCNITTFDGSYEIYEYFNERMRSRNCCIQHNEYDFGVIAEHLEMFDNYLLVAKYGEDVCGLAFCYLSNGEIYIKDIFADSAEILNDLITSASKLLNNESINIIVPPVLGQKTHHHGMARIIDAETMLRIYATTHPKMKMEISLVDPILTENNGTYYINNGILEKKDSISANVVDIEQLTQALFGYHTEMLPDKLKSFNNQAAFMSLMLD